MDRGPPNPPTSHSDTVGTLPGPLPPGCGEPQPQHAFGIPLRDDAQVAFGKGQDPSGEEGGPPIRLARLGPLARFQHKKTETFSVNMGLMHRTFARRPSYQRSR